MSYVCPMRVTGRGHVNHKSNRVTRCTRARVHSGKTFLRRFLMAVWCITDIHTRHNSWHRPSVYCFSALFLRPDRTFLLCPSSSRRFPNKANASPSSLSHFCQAEGSTTTAKAPHTNHLSVLHQLLVFLFSCCIDAGLLHNIYQERFDGIRSVMMCHLILRKLEHRSFAINFFNGFAAAHRL